MFIGSIKLIVTPDNTVEAQSSIRDAVEDDVQAIIKKHVDAMLVEINDLIG
ncbi:hypothetical protein PP740_gp010 [Stenotrophomonas phage Philippe]|uniref:Uncharacterized protein n=1 Tax=Stenotrophomonas phage Philippe TaxID=2859655 RepID=A0AAE7WMH9_9CAUD|nr:hypothetical protein PP740_gp010 [Stenotrophomonas phage Philippe]QYW02209.1 hypothetical protein CPT_Philippe_010 [Stenotrophomonas phage Philippe]